MDDLPTELVLQIAELLPKFDLVLNFAKVSKRCLYITMAVIRGSNSQSSADHKNMKAFLSSQADVVFGPNPYIQSISPNVLCAMDFNTITFSKVTKSSSIDKFQRNHISWQVSYDTNLISTPNSQRTLLWTYKQFSILSFNEEGPFRPRTLYKRALAGKKSIVFSRSGRYLACCARTFSQTHTELHDMSTSMNTPIRVWPRGLQCVDFAPDERSFAFVNSEGQILVQQLHDERNLPEEVPLELCSSLPGPVLNIKYTLNGDKIIVVLADGTILIHDLSTSQTLQVGSELVGKLYSAAMHASPSDELMAITAEYEGNGQSSYELIVICLQTGAVVFRLSQPKATTSSYEFICFLTHISGIIILVNGKLECWIFPTTATTLLQPIRLVAELEDEIHSGRVAAMGSSDDLLVGGPDGKVKVVEMPSLKRVLFGSGSGWKNVSPL